jgi:hypothetical protein
VDAEPEGALGGEAVVLDDSLPDSAGGEATRLDAGPEVASGGESTRVDDWLPLNGGCESGEVDAEPEGALGGEAVVLDVGPEVAGRLPELVWAEVMATP